MTHHSSPFTKRRTNRKMSRALSSILAFGLTAALLPAAIGPAQAHGGGGGGVSATLSTTSFTCGSDVNVKYTSNNFGSSSYKITLAGQSEKSATGSGNTRSANFGKLAAGSYASTIKRNSETVGSGTVKVNPVNLTIDTTSTDNGDGTTTVTFSTTEKGSLSFNTANGGNSQTVNISGGSGSHTYTNTGDNGQWQITGSYGCGSISGKFKLGTSTAPVVTVGATGATITYGQAASLGYTFANTSGINYTVQGAPALNGSGTSSPGTVHVPARTHDVGTYTFTVSDAGNSGKTSSANLVVNKATTTVTPSASSFPVNQVPSNLIATVTGQYGTFPTGIVEFSGAGHGLSMLQYGIALLPSPLSQGTLTISYGGDKNHQANSNTVTITAPVCSDNQQVEGNGCVDVPVAPICDEDQVLNEAGTDCIDKPVEPQTPTCDDNQVLNEAGTDCIDKPVDPETPICTDTQELINGECVDVPVAPTCDDDQVLNEAGTDCIDKPVEPQTPTCDDGQVLEGDKCVDAPFECPEGQELKGDGVCVEVPGGPVDVEASVSPANQTVQWGQSTTLTALVGPNAENTEVIFTVAGQNFITTAGAPDSETGLSTATVSIPAKIAAVGSHPVSVSWKKSSDSQPTTGTATLTVTPAPTSLSAGIMFPSQGSALVTFDVSTIVPNESLGGTIEYSVAGPNGYASGPLSITVGGSASSGNNAGQARLLKSSTLLASPLIASGSSLSASAPTLTGLNAGDYTVTAKFTPTSTNLLASDSAYTTSFSVAAPTCNANQSLVDGVCVTTDSGVDPGTIDPEESEPTGTEPTENASGTEDDTENASGTEDDTKTDSDTDAAKVTAEESDDELAATGTNAAFAALLAFALLAAGVSLVARRRTV